METYTYTLDTTYARARKLNVKKVGDCIVALVKTHEGGLPLDAVIEEARPISSPLHPLIEWDEKKAATAYQRSQIRDFLTRLTVTVQTEDAHAPQRIQVRAVSFLPEQETVMRVQVRTLTPPVPATRKREAVPSYDPLKVAIDELVIFVQRFSHIPELHGVIRAARLLLQEQGERRKAA